MITDVEYAFGRRALLDLAKEEDEFDYLLWGDKPPENFDDTRVVGLVAIVGTQMEKLEDITTLQYTNRAIFIDRHSSTDQRIFLKIYRKYMLKQQKGSHSGTEKELDEPDVEEALAAEIAYELVTQDIVTLGGFAVFESLDEKDRDKYKGAFFCATTLAYALAFDFRSEMMELEPRLTDLEATNETEEYFKALTQEVVRLGKTMDGLTLQILAEGYLVERLLPPNELRKSFVIPPPKHKKKK